MAIATVITETINIKTLSKRIINLRKEQSDYALSLINWQERRCEYNALFTPGIICQESSAQSSEDFSKHHHFWHAMLVFHHDLYRYHRRLLAHLFR